MAEVTRRLLFGIPIDLEELSDRLSAGAENDFAARYAPATTDPHAWRQALQQGYDRRYLPLVAAPFLRLARRASESGFDLVRRATLQDLQIACEQASIVILVSHWKGAEYGNDFLPALDAEFESRVAASPAPVAQWLVKKTARPLGLLRHFRKPVSVRDALRAAINASMDDTPELGVDRFHELPETRAARRRDFLDDLLDGLVVPGNRLELYDGLYAKDEVAGAMPNRQVLLDLAMCTSTRLGDAIGSATAWRIRTVQFPTIQEPADIVARLEATFGLLDARWEYGPARLAVAKLFSDEVLAFAGDQGEC